ILMPTDEMAVEAYSVIREAMSELDRVALGRLTMHTRERLMALEPRSKGLIAYTLRMRDEVVNLERALESIPDKKPNREMVGIAQKIIEQQEGAFVPDEFRDRYEEALRELIRMKEHGRTPAVIAPPADTTNVIDLMAALKQSLGKRAPAPSVKRAAAASRSPKKRSR